MPPNDIDDVVQDTVIHALRALDRFDTTRPMWPWLAAIAANTAIDASRVRDRAEGRILHTIIDVTDSSITTETGAIDAVTEANLARSLHGVDVRHRRVLVRIAQGWSYTDLAQTEDITVVALKSLAARARRSARAAVGPEARWRAIFWPILGRLLQRSLARSRAATNAPVWAGIAALTVGTIIGALPTPPRSINAAATAELALLRRDESTPATPPRTGAAQPYELTPELPGLARTTRSPMLVIQPHGSHTTVSVTDDHSDIAETDHSDTVGATQPGDNGSTTVYCDGITGPPACSAIRLVSQVEHPNRGRS